jgi:hypothetical protein
LQTGGLVVAGSIGNNWLTKQMIKFVPLEMLKTTPGNYVTGLLGAGLLGMVARMVTPKLAGPVFFGGVLDVVMRATNQYVLPMLRLTPLKGLADYLTVGNAAAARPLMGYEDYTGVADYENNNAVGDYLTVGNAASARPLMGYEDNNAVGDYLTVGNAASARPLMGIDAIGEETVGEELACM